MGGWVVFRVWVLVLSSPSSFGWLWAVVVRALVPVPCVAGWPAPCVGVFVLFRFAPLAWRGAWFVGWLALVWLAGFGLVGLVFVPWFLSFWSAGRVSGPVFAFVWARLLVCLGLCGGGLVVWCAGGRPSFLGRVGWGWLRVRPCCLLFWLGAAAFAACLWFLLALLLCLA